MTVLSLPNAEATVINILLAVPAIGAGVGTRLPNPRPATFVRVNRVGGTQRNMVQERPVLLIECWAATEPAAWALVDAAWKALAGREPLEYNGIELEERSLTSPVNYPDPSTSSPRYQFQLETTINLRGPSS